MKTTIFLFISLFLSVNAVSARTATKMGNSEKNTQTENNNQIHTQNAGEDKKIEVRNMEVLEEDKLVDQPEATASQNLNRRATHVSEQVHLLLQSKLASQSGIGQQVRQIAQKQEKAQESIQQGVDKINARSGWLKRFIGTNQTALASLNQQMTENQLRIEELNLLKTKVSNQSDADMIQNTLQSLIEQNTALAQTIQLEQEYKGFFSWFHSLLSS